jgi:hypothetical protein
MLHRAAALGCPLASGSSLPFAWRKPYLEHPIGAKLSEAIIVVRLTYHLVDSAALTLEAIYASSAVFVGIRGLGFVRPTCAGGAWLYGRTPEWGRVGCGCCAVSNDTAIIVLVVLGSFCLQVNLCVHERRISSICRPVSAAP